MEQGSGWLQAMHTPPLTLVVGHQTEIARDAELVTSNKAPGPKRLISATQFLKGASSWVPTSLS